VLPHLLVTKDFPKFSQRAARFGAALSGKKFRPWPNIYIKD